MKENETRVKGLMQTTVHNSHLRAVPEEEINSFQIHRQEELSVAADRRQNLCFPFFPPFIRRKKEWVKSGAHLHRLKYLLSDSCDKSWNGVMLISFP